MTGTERKLDQMQKIITYHNCFPCFLVCFLRISCSLFHMQCHVLCELLLVQILKHLSWTILDHLVFFLYVRGMIFV